MNIPLRFTIGVAASAVATLRLFDIAIPLNLLPWEAYAAEWVIGIILIASGCRAASAR